MFRTVAHVHASTYYRQKLQFTFGNQLLTVNHEKTCSFCQKPEYLQVVNYSAVAQLRGIKSTQQDI